VGGALAVVGGALAVVGGALAVVGGADPGFHSLPAADLYSAFRESRSATAALTSA